MSAQDWFTQLFRWLGHGQYSSAPAALIESDVVPLGTDSRGYLRTTQAQVASYQRPTALATSGVITGARRLIELHAHNTSGDIRYLQIFDAASLPADSASPLYSAPIEPGGVLSLTFASEFAVTNGLCWASSSTLATKTISGAADLWVSLWTV